MFKKYYLLNYIYFLFRIERIDFKRRVNAL